MPTIQVEAQLSLDALFEAVRQLGPNELEQFAMRLDTLRSHPQPSQSSMGGQVVRPAPVLSPTESALLLEINQGLSASDRARFNDLVGKRREETITSAELQELVGLTDKSEKLNATRMRSLVELAQLRGTSLDDIMGQLGIQAPEVLD